MVAALQIGEKLGESKVIMRVLAHQDVSKLHETGLTVR